MIVDYARIRISNRQGQHPIGCRERLIVLGNGGPEA